MSIHVRIFLSVCFLLCCFFFSVGLLAKVAGYGERNVRQRQISWESDVRRDICDYLTTKKKKDFMQAFARSLTSDDHLKLEQAARDDTYGRPGRVRTFDSVLFYATEVHGYQMPNELKMQKP